MREKKEFIFNDILSDSHSKLVFFATQPAWDIKLIIHTHLPVKVSGFAARSLRHAVIAVSCTALSSRGALKRPSLQNANSDTVRVSAKS